MEIAILVYPSIRARKYLEYMKRHKKYPTSAIIMGSGEEEKLLRDMKAKVIKVPSKKFKNSMVYDAIKSLKEEVVIFTGGGIVPEELLELKRFIHIHPGITSEYRGSTCFYYSILKENKIGMTAMFLSNKLDCGDIINTHVYDVPNNINIDNEVDPELRADMLIRTLKENKNLVSKTLEKPGKNYYVIHPVLKHIAILKVRKNGITK